MRRSCILLTLLVANGLGLAPAHTDDDLWRELGRLRKKSAEDDAHIAHLESKSAEDDARIVHLESRLARAENFAVRGEGANRLPSHPQWPLALSQPLSSGAASAASAKNLELSAQRRSILQADAASDSLACANSCCAKDDLRRVQTALKSGEVQAMASLNEILAVNQVCGECIFNCIFALDPVYCLFSCMHQRENQCSDREQLAPLASHARLDDRASIVAILGEVDPDCAYACSLLHRTY